MIKFLNSCTIRIKSKINYNTKNSNNCRISSKISSLNSNRIFKGRANKTFNNRVNSRNKPIRINSRTYRITNSSVNSSRINLKISIKI